MNTTFCGRSLFASCLAVLVSCSPSLAALSLTSLSHSENFDFLASSGINHTWNNDQGSENANGSPGWWWIANNTTGYDASDGSSSAPDRTSFGDDSDRAMGSLTGGANDFTVWSLVIQNNHIAPISEVTVSFIGEKWRNGNSSTDPVTFSYKIGSSASDFNDTADFGDADIAVPAGWTSRSALDFASTDNGPDDQAVDGDLFGNQFSRSDTWTVNVPVGQFIALRWQDGNVALSDHGMAIDDFFITVTAIPEPSAFLFGGLVCGVIGLRYARRKLLKKSAAAPSS
jgi:hypothetical protein